MKDLQSFGWYAAKIAPKLPKEAFKPVPSRLWGGLVYLLIAIAGILVIGLLNNLHPWLGIGIAVILGTCFAGMGFLGHEILHGTVIRKPWLRDFLGAVAFWPLSVGPKLWRKWHNTTHHVHTQEDGEDPDAWPTLENLSHKPFLQKVYKLPMWMRSIVSFAFLSISFTTHGLFMFKRFIKEFKPSKRPSVWLQLLLPWATWLGLLVWLGPVKWFFAVLLPLLIANAIVMSYISTNHRLNPMTDVNDPLANSLTVTVPKWVDVLHFNFSYHTEHHLFPGMSPKYYPLVKKHIKEMWPERYHEMPHWKALVTLWKTPRVYFNQHQFVDPAPGNVYPSLGHGLNPDQVSYQKGEASDREMNSPKGTPKSIH
ncbi:fatty acid desaturase family protein [Fictibacillus arsenicus]|uniref:Acyl-CoA desaturase n=1 Tax=Fictibacillus arsenicus TaxID=255247 RepID=A0A1V3GDD3_9BACL|nr:acyl-CoA desaturase [Fictibacillus arsenicus]OOE14860.1 acyl-CoA desaturase [Fictibacillus arsenicus]